MSALAFEWMPAETETTTSVPVKVPENQSREEEFRLALDRYIANYIAEQKRRDEAVSSVVGIWRRLLTAGREIWLFSRLMNRDWRGDPANMGRYGPVGRHVDHTIGRRARRPHREPSANITCLVCALPISPNSGSGPYGARAATAIAGGLDNDVALPFPVLAHPEAAPAAESLGMGYLRLRANFLDDLSNSGPAVRLYQ